ncbi:MAG: hypothetical protein JWO05_2589 [Gemmatimonadetes bacterium]|nr:hypothetical protein [Gemmatimonadota bacterium]
MHLVATTRPAGTLERAPETSLHAPYDGRIGDSACEYFWNETGDEYYACAVAQDGSEQWFRMVDDASSPGAASGVSQGTPVIPLHGRASTLVMLGHLRPGATPSAMLVGATHKSAHKTAQKRGR